MPADRERGRRIKALRLSREESQAAFGHHFEVEQATVSRWERGMPVARTLWAAMAKMAGKSVAEFFLGAEQEAVPLLSWVSAGAMEMVGHVPDTADAPMIPVTGLGPGDYFALKVEGDSMNRVAPPGAIIIVNHADRALNPRSFYIFHERGSATFKRYAADPPRLEPFSTNPAHEPIFPSNDVTVIGRVRRVILDL